MDGKRMGLAVLLLAMAVSCSTQPSVDSLSEAYHNLAGALGDATISLEKHHKAANLLSEGDKEVIPVLIAHLGDQRIFNPNYREVSESSDADRTVPTRVMTVGEMCNLLLYEVVYGDTRIPQEALVPDWNKWWEANKNRTLSELREETKSLRK
jgi:hypothetical protein